MTQAIIFDMDGTLLDSVDLNALSWHQAFKTFGYAVSFEQARSQIGKGGDHLLPTFLSEEEIADHGDAIEAWRADYFRTHYLACLRPFSAVPDLLQRLRASGLKIAVASSAKQDELDKYLDMVGIRDLVDVTTCSEDAESSKPSPDIFQSALQKLGVAPDRAIAVGDTPYDAQAAAKAGMRSIGVLCGGFSEQSLLDAGCCAVYPGPAALLACLDTSPIMQSQP
jgi:HAD superfamily hydrolase (TIGR01549 family)